MKKSILPLLIVSGLVLGGCRTKPIDVKATATVVVEGNKEKVKIEVQTDPNMDLYASGGGFDSASSTLPYGSQNPTYPGSSYNSRVKADAKGKATLIIPIWADNALEKTIRITADGQQKRPIGKPKYRYGSGSVLVKRSPRILFAPTTREISCIGKSCTGTINSSTFRLDFRDLEPGSTVDLGGAKAKSQTRTLAVTPELGPLFSQVKVDDVFKEYPLGEFSVPLAIAFADGSKLDTKLTFSASVLKYPMGTSLASVSKGPVRFDGESDGPSSDRSIFVSGYRPRLFGTADQAKDIDLVAVLTEDHTTASCGSYVGQTTGTRRSLDRSLTSASVSVFERRSGKKRATRIFAAKDPGCPGTTFSTASLSGTYDDSAVEAFIKSFVKS